ncbi:transcription initiation factor TFIID subunit 13 [[Candida] jaroonii]|uniref:Transcription initiation factor TFIID subunit 13 n=1 Tax=[Candida] jaroonii TaxID=467808 RepID=A0ACA9Y815_9ASCO|nr:transcription initiation factor TFIID subunit 13 [[Candida] jaroonii]
MNSVKKRKTGRLFTKDIEQLLYSLGDTPLESTVNALDDCLVDFLSDLSYNTLMYAKSKNRTRVKIDDFPFVLRNDPFKLSRLEYIINQSIKIENAKKMFDDDDKKYADLDKPKKKQKVDEDEDDDDDE